MSFYMKAYQMRLFCSVLMMAFVYATPKIIGDSQSIPFYYYVGITFVYLLYQVLECDNTKIALIMFIVTFLAPLSVNVCS